MNCPSCEWHGISTTWIDHEFQYGPDEDHVMLDCRVPKRTCPVCGEEWLDHRAEDLMAEVVKHHLKPAIVVDDAWIIEAALAAKRADAYGVHQVVAFMKQNKVPTEEMDEFLDQAREEFPCLFMGRLELGLRQ